MTAKEKQAAASFQEFLTDGHGDSQPVEGLESSTVETTYEENKDFGKTTITLGFKITPPGTYSSVDYSETVEILTDDVDTARKELMRRVANNTHTAIKAYLKPLFEMSQE